MEYFMHCSQHPISKPSRLWAASSFQYGDVGALQIDHVNDGDEYDLHLGEISTLSPEAARAFACSFQASTNTDLALDLSAQDASHPLMLPHTQGDNLDPNIFFIAEPQGVQRDPLIRYTLNPDLVDMRDDYGPPNHGKLSAAETLSQFDPSSQSVHQEEECAPPGLLEPCEFPTPGNSMAFEGSPPMADLTTRAAPPPEEWKAHKANIRRHYMEENRPLPNLRELMKTKYGFSASSAMYKKRFAEWKFFKYKPRKARENQSPTFAISRPSNTVCYARSRRPNDITGPSGNERTPPGFGSFEFEQMPPITSLRCALIPSDGIPVKFIMDDLLTNVSKVYHSRGDIQSRWEVGDPFRVQEDEYDDLFVKVVGFAKNSPVYRSAAWKSGIRDIFNALGPVMKECGLFALPTIWTCLFRLLKATQPQPEAALEFLLRAIRLAHTQGWDEPFQNILQLLPSLVTTARLDMWCLQNGLKDAYLRCLEETGSSLSSSKLTLLSLRAYFVNYIDKGCKDQKTKTLSETKDLVKASIIQNGANSSTTLDIMGQYLFILQSDPVWKPELERVAIEIDQQIKQLRFQNKAPVGAELFTTWKDARHVLAEYYFRKGDVPRAIFTLEEYMNQCAGEGNDDFDQIVKTKLDDWRKSDSARSAEQNTHTASCDHFCRCPWRGLNWGFSPI
ncbi:unnamed protein product [Clonostachys rosea]|uniref:Clr5 domain-containing protein n=1 Tax=Bionectria ochroleuca TaxID=29856 RepID=A0ABY6V0H5_BIOOC|nr:unnamed protein product [Clonostachys rosea]